MLCIQGFTMAKKSRSPYIIAFVLFLSGISYMVYSGISQNSVYFLNVSEALAMESNDIGSARLFGMVSQDNLQYSEDGLSVNFELIDAEVIKNVAVNVQGRNYIPVYFKGTVPDTFDIGAEVIIEGVMSDNGFQAKTLMTKCPSKYEKENREQLDQGAKI